MKPITTIIIAMTLTFGFSSCDKFLDTTWVFLDETSCSQSWNKPNSYTEKQKSKALQEFLEEENVKVFSVEYVTDRLPDSCEACHCKTGGRFQCKIKTKDLEKAKNLGFYTE